MEFHMDIFWLLFFVFFVPISCLVLCMIQLVRGLLRGGSVQRQHRLRRREYDRAFR